MPAAKSASSSASAKSSAERASTGTIKGLRRCAALFLALYPIRHEGYSSATMTYVYKPSVSLPIPSHLGDLYATYRPYSMIPRERFLENLALILTFAVPLDGAFVECGTWMGGMSAAMARLGGSNRDYHFFDSFEGLPEPKEIDGEFAQIAQHNFNRCTAPEEVFRQVVYSTGIPPEKINVYKGWFSDTVSMYAGGNIACLRLDGDWFDSTIVCLENLYKHVVKGGLVIVDDYGTFDGCNRAVHKFLADHSIPAPIERGALQGIAYWIKP
jgi:O-methyltransferase